MAGTTGDGDHDFYGIGLASRYTFDNSIYLDASASMGWATTEFAGKYQDASTKYDAENFYDSVHAGVGYVLPLTDAVNLDIYGRYVLTYLQGDDVDLGTRKNETFEMHDTLTHAFRVGLRFNGAFNEQASWHFGLAYEHVIDGETKSSVSGLGTTSDH